MPTPPTHALTPDDDTLAAALADAVVAGAAHDPALRRLALRAAGKLKHPCDCTADELAEQHGISRFALNRIAARALTKLRLSPELQAIRRI